MEIKLPKGHLSFSQIVLWMGKSKETYRKKYYPDVTPQYGQSPAMAFGNEVTEAMENREEWVSFIPHFETFEFDATRWIDGVKIKAFIDSTDLRIPKFREQKTGVTPWTQNKVNKHLQMDIYSMLLEDIFGTVDDECELIWVKTRKKVKEVDVMGHIVRAESNEIELTGEFEVIPRVITKTERDACRALIVRVAYEITEDYRAMKHLYN